MKKRQTSREVIARNARTLGIGSLLELIQDAIVVTDASGSIVVWNAAATRILGWEPEEAIGMDVAAIVPQRLRPQHDAGMARFRRTGTGPILESREVMELPAVRKDGREIVIDLTLSRLPSPQPDDPPHALAIIRDVTERVLLIRNVEGANRGLRAANETLEAFSYLVSHDLKEPLRGIDAFQEAIEEDHGHELSGGARDLVRRTRDATRRLNTLLDGLLETSRVTRTASEAPAPVRVDRAVLAEGCVARYADVVAARDARLDVRTAPDTPSVATVPAVLDQILGNLILNAVKHNPKPNPTVRVSATAVDATRTLVDVVVEDDGPGIPAPARERLTNGAVEGAAVQGFGLIIVHRAVRNLNGRVWVGTSDLGGSAVHVVLPAWGAEDEA